MLIRRLLPRLTTIIPVRTTNSSPHRRMQIWSIVKQTKYMYCSRPESQIDTKTWLCWNCKALITSAIEFFCPSCNIIQRPLKKTTYFEIMDSPKTFDVDTVQLNDKYKELQWKLHPDKFSDVSEEEKKISEEQSSRVNEAYVTLLKPLSRGLYLLNLHGERVTESEATSTDGEFLAAIMEKYEQISSSSEERLEEIQKENNEHLEKCIQDISDAFAQGDIQTARQEVIKLNYYNNVAEYIRNQGDWS